MNLSQLEYLKELYQNKSFSKAAEKVGVTQPALSLQIQKLEEELDFKLIDRSKRPFEFTDEGRLFYEKSIDILKQIEELRNISLEIGEEVQGVLKIGIIPTVAPYLVPLFIHRLKSEYPLLQIEVSEIRTEEILNNINLGNLDCGVISTPIKTDSVFCKPVFYEKFYAYVSEKHDLFKEDSLHVDSFDEKEIWYLNEGNCFQNQVNSVCKINSQKESEQNLIYRTNSIESLRRIVENRSGITFIPELATINIPTEQEELIKEFSEREQPIREISIVTAKRYAKERQVDAFLNIIRTSIPKRMLHKPKGGIVNPLL